MKCEMIQDLLPTYLDDSCSDETKKVIEEHIKECEECRLVIEELKEMDTASYPIIDESKPFKKIIKHHKYKFIALSVIFVFVFLLFGTRLNSEIVKLRFQHYVDKHYGEYDLVMSDFEYNDPASQGFGNDNGFYIAHFQDETNKDIEFNVFTDGFVFSIKDTFDHQVEARYNTMNRLLTEYGSDVKTTLLRQKDFYMMDVEAFKACTDEYFEKHVANQLTLEMLYENKIDQIIPMNVTMQVNATSEDISHIELYLNKIVDTLHREGYDPLTLTLSIETEAKTYRIENYDCRKDAYAQEIILES